jgi:hypothetical protein
MKYIRTEEHKLIYETKDLIKVEDARFPNGYLTKDGIPLIATKQADTIEELCDEVVVDSQLKWCKFPFIQGANIVKFTEDVKTYMELLIKYNIKIYGARWTNKKGIIYVAKLNEKGEWELL